jgi:hypothetical protein
MSERELIQDRMRRKEQEIQTLEEKLKSAKIYLQALQDIFKALAKEPFTGSIDSVLREGSAVAQARELILKRGVPVHINDLLEGLGRGMTRESRASLTSSISAYVRRREIFTRSAPNTFGLFELGHETSNEPDANIAPPDGFGT